MSITPFMQEPAVRLPLTLLKPSPTNPRKRFDPAKLAELADSIKKQGGVYQPILARRNPEYTEGNGMPPYEIVAGERRWRASGMAGAEDILTLVRDLTDFQAWEIQLSENIDRQDLHPLEEAEGLKRLLRGELGGPGYANADELAARLGKSRRWVFNRLALLNLCETARTALWEDKINASVAGLLARMHDTAQQKEALEHILQGFGGEPLSFRSASEWLQKKYMLRLSNARFDIKAIYAVEGPCGQCGKRSGAAPDLFTDLASGGDHCLDAKCFEAKTDEAVEQVLANALTKGQTVLEGGEARSLMPNHQQLPAGYHWLDKPCPALTDSKRTLRELMGDNKAVVVLDHPAAPMPIALVPDAAAVKVLKTRGLLKELPKPAPAEAPAAATAEPLDAAVPTLKPALRQEEPSAEAAPPAEALQPFSPDELEGLITKRSGELFSQRLAAHLKASVSTTTELPVLALRIAIEDRLGDASADAYRLLHALMGWELEGSANWYQDLCWRLRDMGGRELGELFVLSLVLEELSDGDLLSDLEAMGNSYAVGLAGHYGISLDDLQDEAEEAAEGELRAEQQRRRAAAGQDPAAIVAAAMAQPAKGGKVSIKYRNSATGEAWSGRGLQPRWLKEALANGAKLSDFEAQPQSSRAEVPA